MMLAQNATIYSSELHCLIFLRLSLPSIWPPELTRFTTGIKFRFLHISWSTFVGLYHVFEFWKKASSMKLYSQTDYFCTRFDQVDRGQIGYILVSLYLLVGKLVFLRDAIKVGYIISKNLVYTTKRQKVNSAGQFGQIAGNLPVVTIIISVKNFLCLPCTLSTLKKSNLHF